MKTHTKFALLATYLTGFILASALYLVSGRAEAQPFGTPDTYCAALAQFAYEVSEARNAGVPPGAFGRHIDNVPNSTLQQDLATVVVLVYTRPHGTPAEEGTIAFRLCWELHGA